MDIYIIHCDVIFIEKLRKKHFFVYIHSANKNKIVYSTKKNTIVNNSKILKEGN